MRARDPPNTNLIIQNIHFSLVQSSRTILKNVLSFDHFYHERRRRQQGGTDAGTLGCEIIRSAKGEGREASLHRARRCFVQLDAKPTESAL